MQRIPALTISGPFCSEDSKHNPPIHSLKWVGVDDETFWCSAHEIKRVARYQGKFLTCSGLHRSSVFRSDNFRRLDNILVAAVYGCELNAIPWQYPCQFTEKCVAVPRYYKIAFDARQWGSRHVPGADS